MNKYKGVQQNKKFTIRTNNKVKTMHSVCTIDVFKKGEVNVGIKLNYK
jgi:hypothetical protein